MKFNRYIKEAGMGYREPEYKMSRSEQISSDEALELVKKNHYDAIKGTKIYRRIWDRTRDFILTDPSIGTRKSANISNYYTLIIDNDPAWKKFPRRSKSVIASTSRDYAEYVVLPENGSKIGICPTYDIWSSFEKSRIPMLDVWAGDFETVLGTRGVDKSWNQLRSVMKSVSAKKEFIEKDLWKIIKNDTYFKRWIEDYFIGEERDFIKYVRNLLNPIVNGFKLVKVGSTLPKEREVWTDGKCVLIADDIFELFIKDIR